jgi:hypothetical protein
MKKLQLLMLACMATLAGSTLAADLRPAGVFVQGGAAEDATRTATVGAVWPWAWRRELWGGEAGGVTELFLSHWSARAEDGRRSFTQLGVLPLLRYRFSSGQSPWFVEAGIGFSVMNPVYRTSHKEFSTHFNFVDVAGVGYSFGERRRHELGLRFSHVSNGGIKHPNPGENLVQLRYALMY